ncbi:hypothetical protein [uncultured Amnibacterium sp.]|uniref:hypothetical protein n=1 Tax=uncultured Amnibacterium sp. TaxID=1631851 RepID=UPI0035C966A4
MRIQLKLRLECRPEATWRALQSPTVMREVAGPWLDYTSLERDGFPATWGPGAHPVRLLAMGAVPMGTQQIGIDLDTTTHSGVRIVRDHGSGLGGVPSIITRWYHRMAVAPHPDDPSATLYRDRLEFDAGVATPAMWAGLWALWQWRGIRLQQLAPSFDEAPQPGVLADAA